MTTFPQHQRLVSSQSHIYGVALGIGKFHELRVDVTLYSSCYKQSNLQEILLTMKNLRNTDILDHGHSALGREQTENSEKSPPSPGITIQQRQPPAIIILQIFGSKFSQDEENVFLA